jgi:hypothetical protein
VGVNGQSMTKKNVLSKKNLKHIFSLDKTIACSKIVSFLGNSKAFTLNLHLIRGTQRAGATFTQLTYVFEVSVGNFLLINTPIFAP